MSREALAVIRHSARWFEAAPDGFGALLDSIGDASLVLIGEASHGTHEFYRTRAELTKALITKKGFNGAWHARAGDGPGERLVPSPSGVCVMPTIDVPVDEWPEFLETFSRAHRADREPHIHARPADGRRR